MKYAFPYGYIMNNDTKVGNKHPNLLSYVNKYIYKGKCIIDLNIKYCGTQKNTH